MYPLALLHTEDFSQTVFCGIGDDSRPLKSMLGEMDQGSGQRYPLEASAWHQHEQGKKRIRSFVSSVIESWSVIIGCEIRFGE